ncbi:SNF2-related protein [Hydrogenoanaerobacterium sp.]|uniref:SNF2-related protein n=1 Tax=Hydrogenoanaerobacterium sp. TaxID=2953763 RepID=UPI00289D73A0|nr:SNF2-related protein [Hydrogenoanaerobacterium sp.]
MQPYPNQPFRPYSEDKLLELAEDIRTNDLIYLNPNKYDPENAAKGYETESEYLSGNVREKLRSAQQAAEQNPMLFTRNVGALEKVQPEDLSPDEIEIHLGSSFIPLEYYNQFIYETLNPTAARRGDDPKRNIFVRYNRFNNSYFITNKALEEKSVLAKDTFGTDRMSAYHIIESSMNLQSVTVKDDISAPNEKPYYVINTTETAVAKQKQEKLQESFKEWLFSDVTRRDKIVRIYNDKYNNIRLREYDGSLLSHIDGMNPKWKLRPKQADAVARGIFSGRNALYAHCVGAGKTLTCVTVAMERKRLGLSNKTMIVVPNTLTDQWKNAFLDYFPAANILVATKRDFEKNNRRIFISKIATGNYDAVILGFSQFERIPVSDTLMTRELKNQIADITECIKHMKDEDGEKWTVKQAEAEKKKLENQLKNLMSTKKKDQTITFEELGVDSLIIDEAHNYKNCAVFTKLRNVAGIGSIGAKKSTDLLLKIRYLTELNQGKGCIYFATGTPISNSMTEMFTMERYLMNDVLEEMGFDFFDNWVSVFGETVTSMELKPEGNGYRPRTRLSRFVNLPELMTAFRLIADIQTEDMLNLPKPKLIGGKPQIVVAPASNQLKDFLAEAVTRADMIRNGEVDSTVDNMLKLTGDARRAGTDIRLINPNYPDDPESKVNMCVQNVYDIYHKTSDFKGVQLVFCDISTPNPRKFNVYDDMRTKWISRGIPSKEIAFIHNANNEIQLAKLFSQLRVGQVRILIGSSAKCGAGMNVQDRLIGLHHLDCPWTPKDIVQRDGRQLRPGNCFDEVYNFRYVTEKSFDSYMWSILENKQRFISQIMTSKSLARVCEDIDETVLSYAEIKAIANGNPKIKEKMEIDVELSKLKVLKNEYNKKRFRLQDEFQVGYPRIIESNKAQIKCFEKDIALRIQNTKDDFSIQIDGELFTDKDKAGEQLIKMSEKISTYKTLRVGVYKGFQLDLLKNHFDIVYARLCGSEKYRVEVSDKSSGVIQRLDNALNGFERRISKLEFENAQNEEYILQSKLEYEKPFEHEERLKQLMEKQVELEKELQLNEKPKDEIPSREDDFELIGTLDDELEDDFDLEM